MRALGRTTAGQPLGPLGRGGRRWLPRPLPLSPLPLSNIGTWCVPRPFGVTHTNISGSHRANIGLPPLVVSAAVASLVAAPSSVSLVVDALFLPHCHIYWDTGPPNGQPDCTRSRYWMLRPCILLLYCKYWKTLRVTRYTRGETIYPRNFGSQSCYYPGESFL